MPEEVHQELSSLGVLVLAPAGGDIYFDCAIPREFGMKPSNIVDISLVRFALIMHSVTLHTQLQLFQTTNTAAVNSSHTCTRTTTCAIALFLYRHILTHASWLED